LPRRKAAISEADIEYTLFLINVHGYRSCAGHC
jgi:hypothetical protein